MSTYAGPFSGKDKRALTRADVEERIRRAGSSALVDFTGEDLSGADLSEMTLTDIVFSRADLSGANLSYANLGGADFGGAFLIRANLSGADLIRANLSRANISYANLNGTGLFEAKLSGAHLSGANLNGANLSGANLSYADLFKANLSYADLFKADLSYADLSRAIIYNTRGLPTVQSNDQTLTPGLHLRIIEEPLTLQHLADTLDTFIMLYVKLWLLEQQRFDDFVRYTNERNRSLEAEVPLPIATMSYNSPWKAKINIDLSPKGVVEALQTLVEMVVHFQIRKQKAEADLLSDQLDNQLKQERLKQARLTTIEHAFGTLEQGKGLLEKLSPGLNEEQKTFALQSLAKDVLHLASDATLEITFVPPHPDEKQKVTEKTPLASTYTTETISGSSTTYTEGKTT